MTDMEGREFHCFCKKKSVLKLLESVFKIKMLDCKKVLNSFPVVKEKKICISMVVKYLFSSYFFSSDCFGVIILFLV